MPTYEYACTECGHGFEAVQRFSDDALTECPQCQGRLRKVFSAVGVVFKGSGFYHNDSRASASMNGHSHGSSSHKHDSSTESKADKASESAGSSTAAKSDTAKPAGAKPAAASASTSASGASASSSSAA